jgi:hypothetical protein
VLKLWTIVKSQPGISQEQQKIASRHSTKELCDL